MAMETRFLDLGADVLQVDHAIAHHAAVEQQVGRRHQPVADVEAEDALGSGTLDLLRQVRIPPDVIAVDRHADAVIADTWLSMHDDVGSRDRRHNQLKPYQVTRQLMAEANPEAIFMHCLPAHRDEEVTSEVFDGPQSVVFDEAENRLHAQKGILRWCLAEA